MVDTFHNNRFSICKLPRQSGKSTTIIAYLLHYAIFNSNVNIAILANKAAIARDLLGRLQLAYEKAPNPLLSDGNEKKAHHKWLRIKSRTCRTFF